MFVSTSETDDDLWLALRFFSFSGFDEPALDIFGWQCLVKSDSSVNFVRKEGVQSLLKTVNDLP